MFFHNFKTKTVDGGNAQVNAAFVSTIRLVFFSKHDMGALWMKTLKWRNKH